MYFWDYYNTKGGARWNTGLFRYLEDEQLAQILSNVRNYVSDPKVKKMIDEIIPTEFKESYELPQGARKKIIVNKY